MANYSQGSQQQDLIEVSDYAHHPSRLRKSTSFCIGMFLGLFLGPFGLICILFPGIRKLSFAKGFLLVIMAYLIAASVFLILYF